MAESLDGLGVIQAFNKQAYFTHVTSERVDDAHRALFSAETLNLWLAFICDFMGAAMLLSVACFGIGQWRELGSSNVGLAFSQSIQVGRAGRRRRVGDDQGALLRWKTRDEAARIGSDHAACQDQGHCHPPAPLTPATPPRPATCADACVLHLVHPPAGRLHLPVWCR